MAFDQGSTQFLSPRVIRFIVQQLAGDQDNLAKAGSLKKNYAGWTVQKRRKKIVPKDE